MCGPVSLSHYRVDRSVLQEQPVRRERARLEGASRLATVASDMPKSVDCAAFFLLVTTSPYRAAKATSRRYSFFRSLRSSLANRTDKRTPDSFVTRKSRPRELIDDLSKKKLNISSVTAMTSSTNTAILRRES